MSDEVAKGKLRHLDQIAPFALDVSRRYLSAVGYPLADKLYRACHSLVETGKFSNDAGVLVQAIKLMPSEQREDLAWFLIETTLLNEFSDSQAVLAELDDRLNLHWLNSFGFRNRLEATTLLGEDAVYTIEAFVDRRTDAFWHRQATAERIDKDPLSREDLKIVTHYRLGLIEPSLTTSASLFAGAELLQLELRDRPGLHLPGDAIAKLETIIREQRRTSKPLAREPSLHTVLA